MKNHTLLALWGGLFALCAAMGFIAAPAGALRVFMKLLAIAFFIPPALLLRSAAKDGDRNTVLLVRNLALGSLALTAVLIIVNFLSALGSPLLGSILHSVLVVVSSPMICSGHWALSLFLWASLMTAAIMILKKK